MTVNVRTIGEERAWKCSWDCIFWLLRSKSCFPHLSTIGLTVVTSKLIILQSDCKVIFHLDLDEDFWALLSKMLWVHIGSSWGIYCACLSADIVNCSRQLFFPSLMELWQTVIGVRYFSHYVLYHPWKGKLLHREIRFQGHEPTNRQTLS